MVNSVDRTETLDAGAVELHDRWLRVYFGPRARVPHADFHYVWLRHNCDRDRHPITRERTLDASEIDWDLSVRSARVNAAAQELEVEWTNDPRDGISRFALDWLASHAYAPAREHVPAPPSDVREVSFDARDVLRDGGVAQAAIALVRTHGIAIARHFLPAGSSAPDDTERLVEAFGAAGLSVIGTHFGRIEDLRTDNSTNANTDQLGYTDAGINLHTDQPFLASPPRYQLLHAMRAADEGGDNAIVDALAAARYLESIDSDAFDLLCTVPVHFHRRQKSFEALEVAPILRFDGPTFQVRYSYFTMAPFTQPFARMESWYRAYRRFAQIVRDQAHQFRFLLSAGDFVLYDNHRMLHARTSFRGPRWVRGVYFDPSLIARSTR